MSYFRELPNLQYQSLFSSRSSSNEYVTTKNLFRRVKLRDDLQNIFTAFQKYQIKEGARPEVVANELYGSSGFDWVVLITAGITRVRDQWPLSDRDLYNYSLNIYGNDLNNIHHYETIEVKDSDNRIILPAGKIVDNNFTIPNPTNKLASLNPVVGISNYEYEVKKNIDKQMIYVLKKLYLQQFINDTRKAMIYDLSSQYINDKLIKTENTRVTSP